jgi:hypothetical protein
MKNQSKLALFFFLLAMALSACSSPDSTSPIYVNVVTHNEEPGTPGHGDFLKNEDLFWRHHNAILDFATFLSEEGVVYHWQSDWNFLEAELKYDKGTPETAGKNLVRYFKEDLGVQVDPHAHESKYSYADVAHLFEQLGVEPSLVAGGFLAYPVEESILSSLQSTIPGRIFSSAHWKPEIIWGAGTKNHKMDSELQASGLWRPKDAAHFFEHDPQGSVVVYGDYTGDWEGVFDLLSRRANGEFEVGQMVTASVFLPEYDLLKPEKIAEFKEHLSQVQVQVDQGNLIWQSMEDSVSIWDGEPWIFKAKKT